VALTLKTPKSDSMCISLLPMRATHFAQLIFFVGGGGRLMTSAIKNEEYKS